MVNLVAKSPFWTSEKPAKNSKELPCGFFYGASKGLLPESTKSSRKMGMVVTDTLNCRKELEGLVDMEEVRGTGGCPFWPHKGLDSD
jgi:hypothetical protein